MFQWKIVSLIDVVVFAQQLLILRKSLRKKSASEKRTFVNIKGGGNINKGVSFASS